MCKAISALCSKILACAMSVFLVVLLCPLAPSTAYADDTSSGTGWIYYHNGTQAGTLKITGTMNKWGDDEKPFWNPDSTPDFATSIKKVIVTSNGKLKTAHDLFFYCESLTSLEGFEYLNTDSVDSMKSMFYSCTSLKDPSALAEIGKLHTSSVTNMAQMFLGSWRIPALDLSGWDVSNVENTGSMFYECSNLASVDVSTWNAPNVKRRHQKH